MGSRCCREIPNAQPILEAGRSRKQMKLVMSVDTNNNYRIDEVYALHFMQMADKAAISKTFVKNVLGETY